VKSPIDHRSKVLRHVAHQPTFRQFILSQMDLASLTDEHGRCPDSTKISRDLLEGGIVDTGPRVRLGSSLLRLPFPCLANIGNQIVDFLIRFASGNREGANAAVASVTLEPGSEPATIVIHKFNHVLCSYAAID
jgi:hypothetical protein